MNAETNSIEAKATRSVNPKIFTMWLFIVSIIMLFAAFTSAYLVRKAEGNWVEFQLPNLFWISTVVLLLSSASMHFALLAAKKDQFNALRISISITFVLGLLFLVLQYFGWVQLVEMNVYFVGNPSGSFVYVLSGLHGLHLISGLIVLIVALIAAFRMKINAKALTQIKICSTYWHFLDALWIYLFLFLVFNN
ncbi:cytochrome oxidase subunit III [Aquirufa nivalisilvae]|uniref:Cytochrome-c oxidase n=1 Tax=Aquirufa nivalisilvae TaxID=2516557 RepID=A0A2S2DS35_9BACT|nr:cytochrome c oxidase subunit 3 [Aquirufa nivalisilvae]AWL08211.1 Cytochrome-c oxidase [Aquirufa nivalisilvae]MCZ2478680.1 cytochrome oxidase subunit III [Aquirufa nivalisilvae]MCZ2483419.1 cytochrome oxidase subunit III [Aquirufa nivalisilvae]TBH75620.1 cytochrome oxidase subunit III [Aquirufa nivalisilvae]